MDGRQFVRKDRTKNIKTLLRLFPYLKDKTEASKLKIDNESLHYISVREVADNISKIIIKHAATLNKDPQSVVITDATAGVGGNSISFGMNFSKTYSIELDPERADYLENNIRVYNLNSKVQVINEDCTKVLPTIKDHHIVFLDPPWGGRYYKDHKELRLQIGEYDLEQLCNNILDPELMVKTPNLIVVKLPINYDIKHFYYTVNSNQIYYYNLKKMCILVVVNQKGD